MAVSNLISLIEERRHVMNSKKLITGSCTVALSVMMLASTVTYAPISNSQVYASVVKQKQEPTGQYQINDSFPIDEKNDNPKFDTWSLLDNINRKFYGFKGQGSVWVHSNNAKNFELYINGKNVSLKNISSNKWVKIDISKFTKNGNNALQISPKKGVRASDKFDIKLPYPTLVDKTKEYRNNDTFKTMDALINSEIKNGFPSAELVVVHNGQIIKRSAYGRVNAYFQNGKRRVNAPKVTDTTMYDLASNTKMWATNMAIQKLVSEKKLNIDAKVSSIFPDFKDNANDKIKGKTDLTVRDILMHQAGFPADPQYHNNNYNPDKPNERKKNANPVYTQNRDEVLKKIIATPLQYAPGTKTIYSDVDYMLLGLIIEKVTGQREDNYVENNIYKPLGLHHLMYNPLDKGVSKNKIAATELNGNTRDGQIDFNNIRHYTLQGQVHDEKAYYTMHGVSGHAGLFGDASDLAVLAQTVINRGGYGNHRIFDEDTLDEFIKPKSTNYSYGLGWRREASTTYSSNYGWAFSGLSDASTIGHTGWTGTLTVVDPHDNTAVILLTNERNTPILKPETTATANDFAGGHYLLSKYGDIASLAFAAINKDNSSANNAKLISLTMQRFNEIQKNKDDQTNADKADLCGIYDALKMRSKKHNSVARFLATTKGKQITAYVKANKNAVNNVRNSH